MKINHTLPLLLALSIAAVAQNIVKTAPRADDRFRADVLLVVAHPDDETGVSAYLLQLLDQGESSPAILTPCQSHSMCGRQMRFPCS